MNTPSHQRGFSLIELLVAATIFTFIVAGVTDLFAQALNIQQRATAVQKIEANAQYVIESIAREVRVSKVITANTDCSSGPSASNNTLTINHPVDGMITYTYDMAAGTLSRNGQAIAASDAVFTKFAFCISGSGADQKQVRVTMPMTIQATAGRSNIPLSISLQTTIVSRDISTDLP